MKKIIVSLFALLIASITYAVPAYRGWQTKTQPDGTTIEVRQTGDEFYHYWEDINGNIVNIDANHFWRVVEVKPSAETIAARRQASSMLRSRPNRAIGDMNLAPRGLVILVNFKDVSFQKDNTLAEFKDLMNGENYNHMGAPGSVRKYFSDQSNGQYTPEFDVYGPVTMANNMKYYGGNDANDMDLRAEYMVVEACSIANALYDVDFTRYDNDGDGNVDFVYILYAGYGEADSPEENSIWPHAWDLYSAGIAANKRTFDGKKVLNYACSNELTCLYENKTIVGEMRTGIGTIVHEFSHVIGLPDLYDTSGAENYATPGWWHVMDYGPYCNDGITPPNYTIYDKYFLGWVDMENPGDEAQVLTMAAGEGYQIASSNSLLAATSTNSVYYIENRQQKGWDAYLPGHGMLIWKVMYNQSAWDQNEPNIGSTLRYMLVTAGGDAKNVGYPEDAFPGTNNKTSWSGVSGKPLKDIKESNGVITLTYIGEGGNDGNEDEGGETEGSLEGYTKVTNTASLVAGDKVVLYSDDAALGITGWDGNKTATAAATGWVQYVVEAADGGFLLKDGDQYVALTAKNSFSYNATGSVCKVTADGVLYITLGGNDYLLYENANNGKPVYRMYVDKTDNAQYKPFYVYKAGENSGDEGEGGEGEEPTEPQDIYIEGLQYCDALYCEYEGVMYYGLDLYADYTEEGQVVYPEVFLSLKAKSKIALNGTYDIVQALYYTSKDQCVQSEYQVGSVSVQHVDNQGNYRIKGSFVGMNGNTYHFDNVVNVLAYDQDHDYAEIILQEEGQGGDEGESGDEAIGGDVVFVPGEFETVTNTAFEIEKEGVTIACTSGSITADQFRFFKSQDVTISTTAGVITKIEFTCTANDDAKYGPGSFGAVDGYSYSGKVGTWTGEATSVSFNTTLNQVRATQVVVSIKSNTTTGMEDVDCATGVVSKVLKDGQVLIMRDGKVWNVLGMEL